MWNPFDFTEKKYIIAGATSGIGKATAVRLSEQGAKVFLIARDEEKVQNVLCALRGSGHKYFIRDFSESVGYKEIYDEIVQDGRKIDGIVYSAGIAKILPVGVLNKTAIDESMSVNFYSFVEMISAFNKKKYHDNASIVGVSSISTLYPQKCQGAYVATKSAMNSIVTSLALELAEKGIRINTVMPSSTDTPMLREAFEGKTKEEIERLASKQVLGIIDPSDVASIIMFLLSDASRIVTGRAIYADAGYINF